MTTTRFASIIVLFTAFGCRPADGLPPPPLSSAGTMGEEPESSSESGVADETGGSSGGSPCGSDAAEFVCRGFAIGVYLNPDGSETIEPSGMGVVDLCIDPDGGFGGDASNDYQDIRACAPWHGIDLLDYENPMDLAEEVLIDGLAERCRVRCEQEVSFPLEVADLPLVRIECIISIDHDADSNDFDHDPACSYSELQRVDHRYPRNEEMLDADFKPCSSEECPAVECSGFDPIAEVGFSHGAHYSEAVLHSGLLAEIKADPFTLWECDGGRYAQSSSTSTSWSFEGLAAGGLLHALGLRNGDSNARVWALDPATGLVDGTVFSLDSVAAMVAAYGELTDELHVAVEVERPGVFGPSTHTIFVNVDDCGVDFDGDGSVDIVRCIAP